ncbi:MAG: phospho-N-acetylmuramoyl-pentapeptide-transferase, partial [Oscillospiraceae bacterium]|nr:phospho-N-acetylmuramoyl-pentapeptide-transferase [Oscillospiraceae bacterium]
MSEITVILISLLGGFVLSAVLGRFLIPALRAWKAGQSIREVGPTWHNNKAGTPTMGGIMFIVASLLCLITGGVIWGQWDLLPVLGLALMFGAVGFLDDYIKVKKKRNLGLTGKQKIALQLVASVAFLAAMHFTGELSYELRFPFVEGVICTVPPMLYHAVALFIILGCVNAVNLTDGLDGLSAGVTSPVMLFFTMVALGLHHVGLGTFSAALLGGLGGYLIYNFYPAKV